MRAAPISPWTICLAVPLLGLLAACGGSTSRHGAGSKEGPAAAQAVRLPDPAIYAAQLDAKERYWWQQPERVIAMMECEPGMTVVDLGAGTGYFLPYLSQAVGPGGHVLALDTDRDMIEHLAERVHRERLRNVTPGLVAEDDPALDPRSTDRVLVVNTWHHLQDRSAYAARLYEALRNEGQVFIIDFDQESPKGPPREHRLTPVTVIAELEAAGFTAVQVEEPLPYQYAIRGIVR
ncbi:MAG: methyltransferase [Polyangiales bacterium]